ncbi:MAG: uroporphyrinogen-III synthase [Gammaproteobacteria bacterium]|nr:uroporphyrinogen-III synthase [Gammaproteobacteria bacterium]
MAVLDQHTIVVTRPAGQSQALCDRLRRSGASVLEFPVMTIVATEVTGFQHTLEQLTGFDLAIFISANAVRYACKHIPRFPASLKVAAVGQASARALQEQGVNVDIFPKDVYNSEALLQLAPLQNVSGKNIVIFRGQGGRELLAQTLQQRGANVVYAEVYRRDKPQTPATALLDLWKKKQLDAIVITSNEGLQNLYDMVGETGRPFLRQTTLLLVSERARTLAQQLGCQGPLLVADKADDTAIHSTLINWATTQSLDES